MPKIRRYKHNKKSRKKIDKSIYKSNINKQHVKVNINTGSTPSISHMQPPPLNFTDIKVVPDQLFELRFVKNVAK